MGAPSRLILRVGETEISAFLLQTMSEPEARRITCKECSPLKTRMRLEADVVVPGRGHNDHYYVFMCSQCLREYAVPWVEVSERTEDQ